MALREAAEVGRILGKLYPSIQYLQDLYRLLNSRVRHILRGPFPGRLAARGKTAKSRKTHVRA